MRRRKILTQTLLILSIIEFALAAPAGVRERPEKRGNRSNEEGSTNVPGPDHAQAPSLDSTSWEELVRTHGMAGQMPVAGSPSHPSPSSESGSTNGPRPDHALASTSPDSTDSSIWRQIDLSPPYSPDNLGLIKGWHYVPPSQGSPTGSLLPMGSPVAGSSPLSPSPESGSTNGPRPVHATPSPDSTDSSIWQQVDLNPPYSPDSLGLIKGWDYVPASPGSPVAGSLSPPPPESRPTNMPGPGHVPVPSLDATDGSSIWQEIYFNPPYSPDSQGWDHVLPSPGPPTGLRLPLGSPVAGSLSPPPEVGPTNAPGHHAPPPSPDSTDSIWWQTGRTPPHSPDSLGSLTGWNFVPPNPGSPTMPVASSLSPSPEGSGSTDVPGPNYAPPSPDSTDSIWWQTDRASPYSPDSLGSLTPPNPGSMPLASLSPSPPPSPHPSQPGPSEDNFPRPSGFSVNPDTLPLIGSTGNPPTPPQGPGVDSEMDYLLNPEPIPTEFDFLDKILKDRIKRHISGSDSVNLVRKGPRFLKIPRRRHDASMPLHGTLGQLQN